MKKTIKSIVGAKIARLTVIGEYRDSRNLVYYICKCDCGKETTVYRGNLISGKTKSCGCLYKQSNQKFKKKNEFEFDEINGVAIGKTTNTGTPFLIDIEDYEKVINFAWHESKQGYIHHKNGRVVQLHRLVTNCPRDMVVDHINHNTKDNRKSNLRVCTQKENCQNRKNYILD